MKIFAVPKTTILGSLDTLVPVKIKEWYETVGSHNLYYSLWTSSFY